MRQELPGLRGFGVSSRKNMRLFYETWHVIESNLPIAIGELEDQASIVSPDNDESIDSQGNIIRQLQLANLQDFPLVEFLSISFTHHIRILENTKDTDERLFYVRYCYNYKPATDELPGIIKQQDLYHHQGNMPNNFLATLPDYKQAEICRLYPGLVWPLFMASSFMRMKVMSGGVLDMELRSPICSRLLSYSWSLSRCFSCSRRTFFSSLSVDSGADANAYFSSPIS